MKRQATRMASWAGGRVLVVGGGIGGLSTALSLHAVGIPCAVFDASTASNTAHCCGTNLQPAAVAQLYILGLRDQLEGVGPRDAAAIAAESLSYYTAGGDLALHEARGIAAGAPLPQLSIHRGRLQRALLDAAEARGIPVAHDRRMIATSEEGNEAVVSFVDVAGETHVERGAVVIGADGLASTLRQQLHPDEGPPLQSGTVVWRGTTRLAPPDAGSGSASWQSRSMSMSMTTSGGRAMTLSGGKGDASLALFPICERERRRGGALVSWAAELPAAPRDEWSWETRGAVDDFVHAFDQWHLPFVDGAETVEALVRDACDGGAVWELPVFDREPVEEWRLGSRRVLLGDAAHPMRANRSHGPTQAILDGRALAEHLAAAFGNDGQQALRLAAAHSAEIAAALDGYARERQPVTAAIVHANRTCGPERILEAVEQRGGNARAVASFEDNELVELAAAYADIASLDASAVRAMAEPALWRRVSERFCTSMSDPGPY